MLSDKTIVVGVTGGIALYKSAELISRLKKLNAKVHVIMTRNACEFVTPLTFQTLSQNLVITDMFKEPTSWEIEHISLSQKADMFLIVPATANIIGKIANGIADDMLSTAIMATKAPIIFAPAMNCNMYENTILQNNIKKLKEVGYRFIEPDVGRLACGEKGLGRLTDIDNIIEETIKNLNFKPDLQGKTVLITAGPTREYIDPVRFVSNASTGKMGYALSKIATRRGANVILISGPCSIKRPSGVEFVSVTSAQEMYEEVAKRFEAVDILIKCGAVADYRPKIKSEQKIKKISNELIIEMEKNPDILKKIIEKKGSRLVIGFSMETENLEENARKKLIAKKLDMIVANDVTKEGAGFETDTNVVKVINKNGEVKDYPIMLKEEVANVIFDEIVKML